MALIEPSEGAAYPVRAPSSAALAAVPWKAVADADVFIASIALSRGATVVTGNRKQYERIPGLPLEDWLRP